MTHRSVYTGPRAVAEFVRMPAGSAFGSSTPRNFDKFRYIASIYHE